MDDLPSWPGAAEAYSRSYRILQAMAVRGHVVRSRINRRDKCHVSQEMRDAIEALNRGDEEAIKGFNMAHLQLDPALSRANA